MDKEQFLRSGLIEQYVLGLTTPEEAEMVERYMRAFPEVAKKVASLKQDMDAYAAHHFPEIAPSAVVKTNTPKSSRWPGLAIAASVFLLAGCTVLAYAWQQADRKNQAAELALEGCRAEHNHCLQTAEMLALLEHVDTRPIYLNGTPVLPQAKALVYWNHTAKSAYFNAINLPEAPHGHQYQIWADVAGVMINMGLVDPANTHLQALRYIPEAESLNITIEPDGGSEHPTVSQLCLNGNFLAAK